MSGIVSYGAYIPYNRLQRAVIAAALGSRAGQGERSVASYDEDTVTMGVEAARNALRGDSGADVSALYFATTDPPYQEKLNSATIHAALQLGPSVRAVDMGCSARAGLGALMLANDTAHAGKSTMAVVSDIRLGAPESGAETSGGDGAAAFVFGTQNVIAEVEATYSETLEHLSLWRLPGDRFAKIWEERFSITQAYTPLLNAGIKGLLETAGIALGDLSAIAFDTPNPRVDTTVAKGLGVDPGTFVDGLFGTVGHTGAAHSGLLIATALDKAKPGDRIAVFSVSDGVDAVLLKVTGAITSYQRATTVQGLIDSKRDDLTYTNYLKWREILRTERPRRPDPARPAGPPSFRSRQWKFGFVGSECTECGTRHLPPQPVCVSCGAARAMKDVSFANQRAKITTYTLDRLAYTLQPPMVSAIIDFADGGRKETEVTDCEPERVDIGDEVEMTFRRIFTADGVHNYFWKARPVR